MSELKLGNKHECPECGVRFYDLGKRDPICPKCGSNSKEPEARETPAASQSARTRRKTEVSKRAADGDEDLDDLEVTEVDDEDLEDVDDADFADDDDDEVEGDDDDLD